MISRASGSLTAIRTLFLEKTAWTDLASRFLPSWAMVRWGGVSLLVGGTAWMAAAVFGGWISVREASSGYVGTEEWIFFAPEVLRGVGALLVSVGLLGLYAALTRHPRWLGRLARAGAILAVPLGIGFGVASLYWIVVQPLYYGWGLLDLLSFCGIFGHPAGVVMMGVVALRTRALGGLRPLPLVVGLVGSPLTYLLIFRLFASGQPRPIPGESVRQVVVEAVIFETPMALAGLGWLLVGFALLGARKREATLLEKERRATEERNRPLARRLYEEAFGAGDLSAVDELAAPDLFDHRGGHRGPEKFKHAIADLRRTFPDLRLSIEEQTAEGDEVTTRCSLSGTDRGGFLWYPPTNRRATFAASYTDRFADGKLVEHDGESDKEGLLKQLGFSGGEG